MKRWLAVLAVLALGGEVRAQTEAVDWFRLGAQELAAGALEKATDAYEKGVAATPEAREGWYNLGIVYGRRRMFAKEVQAYQKALEIDPNYANALHNLGLAHLDLGQKDKAVDALQRMVKVQSDAGDAWNNLGVALLEKGDLDGARSAFAKAADVMPQSPDPRFNLGVALMRLAEREASSSRREPILADGLKVFDEVLRLDPANFRAAYNQGVIQHRMANPALEIEAYRKALALKPDHGPSMYNLAAALSAKGETEGAIRAWEAYLEAARGDSSERTYLDSARKELVRLKGL